MNDSIPSYPTLPYIEPTEKPATLGARLWGSDLLEKPEPQVGEECLVYDKIFDSYEFSIVSNVDPETRTYQAFMKDRGTYMNGMAFKNYRPVS